jgi:hypothetical protein
MRRNLHRNGTPEMRISRGFGDIPQCRARLTFRVRWYPDSAGVAGSASSIQPGSCRGFPALRRVLRRTIAARTIEPSERSTA